MLVFIKRSEEGSASEHFQSKVLPLLQKISNEKLNIANIDGAMLSEEKFSSFCEVSFPSSDYFNRLMQTPEGKQITKELAALNNVISVFFADYGGQNEFVPD